MSWIHPTVEFMTASGDILKHEILRLESSLSVLVAAARGFHNGTQDDNFLQSEIPLAIEDAKEALKRLRDLQTALSFQSPETAKTDDTSNNAFGR